MHSRPDGARRRALLLLAGLLAALPLAGCYGPFPATRRVWHWTWGFENEWGREAVFLAGAVVTPVWLLATVGDAFLFNAVCFWSGESWIDEPGGDHHLQAVVPIDGREWIALERDGATWRATLHDGASEIGSWPVALLPADGLTADALQAQPCIVVAGDAAR